VGEQPIFDQEVRVEQQLEPASHRQLVLLPKLFRILRRPTGSRRLGSSLELALRVVL
jgi:hypothetical protein